MGLFENGCLLAYTALNWVVGGWIVCLMDHSIYWCSVFTFWGFLSHIKICKSCLFVFQDYLAWRRGLRSFKAKYLHNPLLGFIRNFSWRS